MFALNQTDKTSESYCGSPASGRYNLTFFSVEESRIRLVQILTKMQIEIQRVGSLDDCPRTIGKMYTRIKIG